MSDRKPEGGEIKDADVDKPIFINGIEYIGWAHPQPDLEKLIYTNTKDVIAKVSQYDKAVIALDGIMTSASTRQNSFDISRYMEIHDLFKIFAGKDDILLGGDFISNYGRFKSMQDRAFRVSAIQGTVYWTALTAGLIGANAMNLTRREFLKLIPITVGSVSLLSTPIILGALNLNVKTIQDNVDSQNFDHWTNKIDEIYDNTGSMDTAIRTGISIAKHQRLRASGYLESIGEMDKCDDLSIWGTDHIVSLNDLELVKKIAVDPVPYAKSLLERETVFLTLIGKSMSEVAESTSTLRMEMAGIIPNRVRVDATMVYVNPVCDIFYDERVLGFSPTGMSHKEIRNRSWEKSQALYFSLTDDEGNLKI